MTPQYEKQIGYWVSEKGNPKVEAETSITDLSSFLKGRQAIMTWVPKGEISSTDLSSFSRAERLFCRMRSFSSSLRTTRFCASTWNCSVATCSTRMSFSSRSSLWIWFDLILWNTVTIRWTHTHTHGKHSAFSHIETDLYNIFVGTQILICMRESPGLL